MFDLQPPPAEPPPPVEEVVIGGWDRPYPLLAWRAVHTFACAGAVGRAEIEYHPVGPMALSIEVNGREVNSLILASLNASIRGFGSTIVTPMCRQPGSVSLGFRSETDDRVYLWTSPTY